RRGRRGGGRRRRPLGGGGRGCRGGGRAAFGGGGRQGGGRGGGGPGAGGARGGRGGGRGSLGVRGRRGGGGGARRGRWGGGASVGGGQRGCPGVGAAVGVAGVSDDVAGRDAAGRHRGGHAGQFGGGVVAGAGDGDPAGGLGGGLAVLAGHHDRGREIVAEEHFSFLDAAAGVAVAPGGLRAGAGAGGLMRHWPCPGLHVRPVGGHRGAGVLERLGDARFGQLAAHVLQARGGGAVGLVFGQRAVDDLVGVLDLAVGEPARSAVPACGDAEPFLAGPGQAGQRGVDFGEAGGPAAGPGRAPPRPPGARPP